MIITYNLLRIVFIRAKKYSDRFLYTFSFLRLILSTNLISKSSFSRMDIGKQRKPSVDAKYLHAFAPSPLSQNGQHGLRHPVEGKNN